VSIDTLNLKFQFNVSKDIFLYVSCFNKTNMCSVLKRHTQYCSHYMEIDRFNILDHMKITCEYEPYGCKDAIKYTQKCLHIKPCPFSSCICTQTDRNFTPILHVRGPLLDKPLTLFTNILHMIKFSLHAYASNMMSQLFRG